MQTIIAQNLDEMIAIVSLLNQNGVSFISKRIDGHWEIELQ